jgi:hypothetical protein
VKHDTTMREVVERLRVQNSDALLELAEFDQALDEFLKNLELIAPTVQDLHQVSTTVVQLGKAEALAWIAVRDQVAQLNTWVGQFLGAFRQMRSAVQGWNITGGPDESALPTDTETT